MPCAWYAATSKCGIFLTLRILANHQKNRTLNSNSTGQNDRRIEIDGKFNARAQLILINKFLLRTFYANNFAFICQ